MTAMRIDASKLSLFGLDLSRAWSWWLEGMQQILPPGWTGFFFKTLPCIVAEVSDETLTLLRQSPSGERKQVAHLKLEELEIAGDGALLSALGPMSRAAVAQTDVVLCLPEDSVLLRRMTVPVAARSNLHAMVGYQIPRLTPFSADSVYFDVRMLGVDEAAQTVDVEVLIALRSVVDPLVGLLRRLIRLPVGRVTIAHDGRLEPFNLLPGRAGGNRWWRRLSPNAYLVALLMVVLAAAVITPVYKQRSLVVERKLQLLELNARAADLLAKKQTLDTELALIGYMANRRQDSRSPLVVLAELTRVIPESVFVNAFLLRDGEVEIGGAGTGVVDLIDRINSSPLFEGARFTSPLSRDSRTGRDQFRITFRLRQGEGGQ